MNFSKKTIILRVIIIVLIGLTIYQLNKIRDLKETQNIYEQKINTIFLSLLMDSDATMDIADVLEELGDPDSTRELWQDLDLIKRANRELSKWELEMINIIATADDKNIPLEIEKSVGYPYLYSTYSMTFSTDRQMDVAYKVFSNKLDHIITSLLYFVDPPRLTPETKSFFREISSEFKELNEDLDNFRGSHIYLHEKRLPKLKESTLNIIESHLEEINSMSLEFNKSLKTRLIEPK